MHHLSHFNFVAILVAAVIQFFLGAIWYSFLFVKPWMAAVGHTPKPGERPKGMVTSMIASFIGNLVLAFILAHVIYWSNANTLHRGLFIGFICWLGFVIAPLLSETMYEKRPYKLFLINSGYWLVSLLIAGGILALWR